MDEKIGMVANMTTLFTRWVLWRSSFLGNLKPLDKKLGLWITPTWGILFNKFSILFATPIIASNQFFWVENLDRPMYFSRGV